jgi:hypothetical protein
MANVKQTYVVINTGLLLRVWSDENIGQCICTVSQAIAVIRGGLLGNLLVWFFGMKYLLLVPLQFPNLLQLSDSEHDSPVHPTPGSPSQKLHIFIQVTKNLQM